LGEEAGRSRRRRECEIVLVVLAGSLAFCLFVRLAFSLYVSRFLSIYNFLFPDPSAFSTTEELEEGVRGGENGPPRVLPSRDLQHNEAVKARFWPGPLS
jgi:hypothetical protein